MKKACWPWCPPPPAASPISTPPSGRQACHGVPVLFFHSLCGTLLDCDWSFEYVPAGEGGNAVTHRRHNLAVTSVATEEEQAACKTFIEYVTSPENCAKVFIETANLPVRQSVLELDTVKEYMAANPFTENLLSQLDFARNASCVTKNIGSCFTSVSDMVVRLIYNGEDIEATLEEYNEMFQDEFDEKKLDESFIY